MFKNHKRGNTMFNRGTLKKNGFKFDRNTKAIIAVTAVTTWFLASTYFRVQTVRKMRKLERLMHEAWEARVNERQCAGE